MGLTPDKPSRKSAGVVGEVLKLYHPHGDGSVYGAAEHMAQPWSLLHPLISGQGNFGSIDGDGPAAYRYTEMKLSRIAMNFFVGIDKEAVEVRDNFDATTTEPTIQPVNFPNILINGTDAIIAPEKDRFFSFDVVNPVRRIGSNENERRADEWSFRSRAQSASRFRI